MFGALFVLHCASLGGNRRKEAPGSVNFTQEVVFIMALKPLKLREKISTYARGLGQRDERN